MRGNDVMTPFYGVQRKANGDNSAIVLTLKFGRVGEAPEMRKDVMAQLRAPLLTPVLRVDKQLDEDRR